MVWEDYQGIEEDDSKEAVMNIIHVQVNLISWTLLVTSLYLLFYFGHCTNDRGGEKERKLKAFGP